MATTFLVYGLGSAPVIDTVEGGLTSENHAALNGLTFGSAADPVSGNLSSLSPATDLLGLVDSYTGGTTSDAYDANNLLYNERFIVDGVTRTHDATMIYSNTIITYTDGTTAIVEAMVMQDTSGNLYLLPPPTGPDAYSDALEAKPIASITLGTATPANGTEVYAMIADRYVLDLQDGVVAGTETAELIDGTYVGDPQGDRVDDTDNMAGNDDDLILALGGDDTVLSGDGNDQVDGGTGNDRLQGDAGNDTVLGGDGNDLILGDGPAVADAVLVADQDFSGGATGWTNPITTTDGQFGDFQGRFAGTNGDSSGGPLTEATFDLANGYDAVVIEFDLYLIDSWDANEPTWSVAPDGDAFQLYINGQQVANELFSNWNSNFFGDRIGTVSIAGVTYDYSFVLSENLTDLGGVSFNDQVWHVRLEATNYTAEQITIGFGATTQSDINDESLGIDNLTIVSTNDTSIDTANAAGNDTLIGGAGNDTLQGGHGSDVMAGEAGSDTFVLENGFGDDTILGGEDSTGDDLDRLDLSAVTTNVTVSYTGDEAGTLTDGTHTASFAEIERITMGEGADLVDAALTTQGVTVTLLGGDDTMIGGLGNDSILAGAGNDSVSGGAGDDTINTRTTPGTGLPDEAYPLAYAGDTDAFNDRDTVDGGLGNDLILTGDDNDIVLGGDGDDSIDAGFDDDIVDGGAGADRLEGNEGNDTIDAGTGDDLIFGDVAPDNPDYSLFAPFDLPNDGTDLAPANNADSLFGGDGNDTIYGQDDNDTIDGGAGDDLIVGGLDNDSLTGGDGNDTFAYTSGDGLDTIADFNFGNTGTLDDGDPANNDVIDLSGFYDNIAQLQDDYADDGILNQSNSGAVVWGQTVDYTDNTQFASGDGIVLLGQTADGTSFTQENTGVVCFTADTLILTERGERPVQSLRPGDRIVTRDNGVRPLQWLARRRIGQHALAADPRLRPILLDPALTGAHAPLLVSPQHGVLLRPGGRDETLVRAVHLTRIEGRKARVLDDLPGVTYFHLMFDAHQIVFANGAPSESFYPGPMALRALSEPARRELETLFPALFDAPSETIYGARARHFARFRDLPDHQNAFRAA